MSTEIRTMLEFAAEGPAPSLDLAAAWRRGRQRRRSQRLAVMGALAVFVVGVAALVMAGWHGSESIGPAVNVPEGVSPIPGLAVSVDLPTGTEVGPDRVFGVVPTARNMADQILTDPSCILDRYTVWISPAGNEGDSWQLPVLEHDRTTGCSGSRSIQPGAIESFATGLSFVTAQGSGEEPLAPGGYLIEIRFDDGGSAFAALTVSNDPTSATTVVGQAPGSEDYVTPEKASMYSVWIHDYDPQEAAWLERAGHAPLTDMQLVTTLEFRRACRVLDLTLQDAQAADAAERAMIVDRLMAPQIQRLNERMAEADDSASYFTKLATQMTAGDFTKAQQFVSNDCARTIGWTPDTPIPD